MVDGRPFDDYFKAPWLSLSGTTEDELEREEVQRISARIADVLHAERLRLTRVFASESSNTEKSQSDFSFRKQHRRLNIEIEWDEWHPTTERE